MTVLRVRNLVKRFGGLTAVGRVDYDFEQGTISAVIGPNGAGKTTLFNMITGIYAPDKGVIELEGRSIVGLKPHRITARGMARTFQNIRLFGGMSVIENVMVGMHGHLRSGLLGILLQLPRVRGEERRAEIEAYQLLEYVGLERQL
ncbi:ATP-binding cassette domain-containing protein, partial [Paenibacillus sepulcri]|nr:ATP-binding cassette domain-containing protein [Paenibacillus sepulcri]